MKRFFLFCLLATLASVGACDCAGPLIVDVCEIADVPTVDARHNDALATDTLASDTMIADASADDAEMTDSIIADLAVTDSTILDHLAGDQELGDQGLNDHGAADQQLADQDLSDQDLADHVAVDLAQQDSAASDPDAGHSIVDCSQGGLCIVLTWDNSAGDLDLHLARNQADYCTDQACYWANCNADAAEPVDWDGVAGFSSGDPRLYGDRSWGLGPEILQVESPSDGTYDLGLFFNPFPGLSAVTASVGVFSQGQLLQQFSKSLAPGEFWELATLSVISGNLSAVSDEGFCSVGQWLCTDPVGTCR